MKNIISTLKKLTLNDLNQWAGDTIVNRAKAYLKQVENLSYCSDGRLVAYVNGSERYLTYISFGKNNTLESYCSCPYWATCKHAVALVLVAAEQIKNKQEIPLLTENDELHDDLFSDDEIFDDGTYADTPRKDGNKRTKSEEKLETSNSDKLISKLQQDIKKTTAQDAWYDSWNHRGEQPDYSSILKQMKNLLNRGQADALLKIGEDLFKRGQKQVEQSNDDGNTASDIAECMAVVVKALPQTSLTRPQQFFWFIEHEAIDEFELLTSGEELLDNAIYQPADWKELIILLNERIAKNPKTLDSYSRTHWIQWLLTAYEKARMKTKIIPLLEQEAENCNLQIQLIEALLAEGEKTKARQYCIRFYNSTIKKLPGIANKLQSQLRDMAEQTKKYDLVAAYYAQDFFKDSSAENFLQLKKATTKADNWPAVRTAGLNYLETGIRPDTDTQRKNNSWPLPKPEVAPPETQSSFARFPNFDQLIKIAILEKRIEDIVTLFERIQKAKQQNDHTNQRVAQALTSSHPQIALDIWQKIAEQHIALAKPNAYIEAASYLRLMQKIYKTTKRLPEWNKLILQLRTMHKAKKRLLEVLDGLEDKKLV